MIFYSKPKFGQVIPKSKILLDLLEYLHTCKFKGNKNEYDNDALDLVSLNKKLAKLVPKFKVSLNLHKHSHTSQFKDSKYKYDIIKRFFKLKSRYGEIFAKYSNFVRSTWKLVNLNFAQF